MFRKRYDNQSWNMASPQTDWLRTRIFTYVYIYGWTMYVLVIFNIFFLSFVQNIEQKKLQYNIEILARKLNQSTTVVKREGKSVRTI